MGSLLVGYFLWYLIVGVFWNSYQRNPAVATDDSKDRTFSYGGFGGANGGLAFGFPVAGAFFSRGEQGWYRVVIVAVAVVVAFLYLYIVKKLGPAQDEENPLK